MTDMRATERLNQLRGGVMTMLDNEYFDRINAPIVAGMRWQDLSDMRWSYTDGGLVFDIHPITPDRVSVNVRFPVGTYSREAFFEKLEHSCYPRARPANPLEVASVD